MKNVFDYVTMLVDNGMGRDLAQTSVEVTMDLINKDFATKSDFEKQQLATRAEFDQMSLKMANEFKAVRSEMASEFQAVRSEIQSLRKDMNHRFEEFESRLTLKLGSMLIASTGIIGALIKFF